LVPAGDEEALRERLSGLAADRASAREMGSRARAAANARFSLEAMSRAYLRVYDDVLNGRSAAA
jgi:glycosyltransferase involved in cell wall biosynthesis